MKEYNKSSKLEHVAYDIRGPVLEEAMRMRANGEKILRLNTGNPAEFGFTAPDEVIHDLIMNARDSEGYSDSKGIFSARKAIMQYCQLKKIPNVDINDIYLGNGVSELIVMSMQGLLDNGDEVLVPMPDYPLLTSDLYNLKQDLIWIEGTCWVIRVDDNDSLGVRGNFRLDILDIWIPVCFFVTKIVNRVPTS